MKTSLHFRPVSIALTILCVLAGSAVLRADDAGKTSPANNERKLPKIETAHWKVTLQRPAGNGRIVESYTEYWGKPEFKFRMETSDRIVIRNNGIEWVYDKQNNTYKKTDLTDGGKKRIGHCAVQEFMPEMKLLEYRVTGVVLSEQPGVDLFKDVEYPTVELRVGPRQAPNGNKFGPQHIMVYTDPKADLLRATIVEQYGDDETVLLYTTITEYEYDTKMEDDMFTFQPPIDARDVTESPVTDSGKK
jgi:outer membrane lipoprotein-sorting protein